MTYEEWNLALCQHFFNEEMAGREVLLYANEALIKRLGGTDTAWQDFLSAIKQGPVGSTRSGLCQKALQASEKWQDRSHSFPPYIAHLVFFVIAAGTDEDFAAHAFYPRVWRLLGEDKSGSPPSFDQMINLWSELETWSREDRHEELGRFVAWPRGGWIHVGMPRSQLILSEDERKGLPRIFYLAELDPTAPPATDVLIKDLISNGRDILRSQTIQLLSSPKDEEKLIRDALAEFVLEELSHWNGEFQEDELGRDPAAPNRVRTGLRICLEIDSFAHVVRSYFRFKATRPFPADGLEFDEGTEGQVWECKETHQGWSSPLLRAAPAGTQQRVDASIFDWKRGLEISDSRNGWRARMRAANVRLFFSARYENLPPGWVEAHKLQRERDFLVLAAERSAPAIRIWGSASCASFAPYDIRGLPAGWLAFSGKGATQSCPDIDVLSLPPTARLTMIGGIKTGRGTTYFDFAPPKIAVENYSILPTVRVNGIPLKQIASDASTWNLPANLPVLTPLIIEVEDAGHVLKRNIRLQSPMLASSWDNVPSRDSTGKISTQTTEGPRAQGAVVDGEIALPPMPATPHLPTYLSTRIIFLGRLPGQICQWPDDEIPSDWHPTWAVARVDRERWQAHFCGTEQHLSGIPVGNPISDRTRARSWKQVLWNFRKVTDKPSLPRLRLLWNQYVEAAQNV